MNQNLSLTVVLLLGVGSTYFMYNNNFSKNNNQSHGLAKMEFFYNESKIVQIENSGSRRSKMRSR